MSESTKQVHLRFWFVFRSLIRFSTNRRLMKPPKDTVTLYEKRKMAQFHNTKFLIGKHVFRILSTSDVLDKQMHSFSFQAKKELGGENFVCLSNL